jgi:hypothetical protein
MRTTLSTLALAAMLAAAPAQAANQAPATATGELTPLLILGAGAGYHDGYDSGWGVGLRYKMPLAPRGVIGPNASNIRDEIDLEFGADLVTYAYRYNTPPYDYRYSWTALRPRVGVMWEFWFTPQIALYPKLDLGYQIGWYSGWDAANSPPAWNGLFLEPSLGFIWQFKPTTSLRIEAGSEGLKVGVGFAF